MKKLFKTLMGTFLLVAGLFPIFCAKNNANPAYAAEGDRVTDVISVDTMKAEGINLNSWSLKTINSKPENNFDCDYKINTQLGATKISTLEDKEKNLCFKLETGSFSSNAVGLMSTKLIGFVRSVSIEFGDYSIIRNDFLTVDLYGSNNDDYSNAATQPSLIHADETKELIYSFTFDKLDENYTDYVAIENNDYKYIGIIIDMGEIGTPQPSFIKSISIEWELHDFSKTADISTNFGNGINLLLGQTFQLTASATGDGEYTNNQIIYKSSNNNVITVDQNGLITAVGPGVAKVRVQYGLSYVECKVVIACYNEITLNISSTATRIENSSGLHEGDIIYIVYEPEKKVLSEVINSEGKVGRCVDCEIDSSNHTLTACNGGEYFYVVGNEEIGFSFISTSGEIISFEDDENWTGLASNFPNDKWDVSIENGIATITNKSNNDINLTYDTEYHCYDAMGLDGEISIFKFENNGSNKVYLNDCGNTEESFALLFSHKFLNVFSNVCDINGNTDINLLKEKWDDIFITPCDEFANLNAISFLMLQNAEADPNGDPIQQAAALYEYIVGKYAEFDFSNRNYLERAIPASAIKFNSNQLIYDESDGTLICILLVSSFALLSSTFLLIRKKKNCQ